MLKYLILCNVMLEVSNHDCRTDRHFIKLIDTADPLSLNTSVPLHTLDQEGAVFQADSDFSLLTFTFVQGYDDLCLQYIANDIDCR